MSRLAALLSAARSAQAAVREAGLLGPRIGNDLYDQLVTDADVARVSRRLFADGHYAQAVQEAFKLVNNLVKRRVPSLREKDGAALMQEAFSPNAPYLKVNSFVTASDKDQQLGYMQILAGCMTGVRNPGAHENLYVDDPNEALVLLVWANHLVGVVKDSRRDRKPKKKAAHP